MMQACEKCGIFYDDVDFSTICPHDHISGNYCKKHDLFHCNICTEKMEKIMNEKQEHERRMVFARQKAAAAWQQPATSAKPMEVDLAEAFAEILVEQMYAPHLGCATTGELFLELQARTDNLDYKTIDSD